MDQYSLESLSGASIGSLTTISDHAPAPISLHPLSSDKQSWTWRLNENILDDSVALKQESDLISFYFVENSTDEVGLAYIWEGHKAVVRGELTSQGLDLKKDWKGNCKTYWWKFEPQSLGTNVTEPQNWLQNSESYALS